MSCGGVESKGYIFERTNFNCLLNNMTSNVFLKFFVFQFCILTEIATHIFSFLSLFSQILLKFFRNKQILKISSL